MYADDIAIGSQNRQDLQEFMDSVAEWAGKNLLQLNEQKTVHMTFQKGGRTKESDRIHYSGDPLQRVTYFKYLGMTLQSSGKSFHLHAQERAIAAARAMNDIYHISSLSLETAIKLFRCKVRPVLTYGIHQIWQFLKKRDLQRFENVKTSFLKRALGVFKFTPNGMVYEFPKEPFLIEELRLELLLPSTEPYESLLRERNLKRSEIPLEFHTISAMIDRNWPHRDATGGAWISPQTVLKICLPSS